MVALKLKSIGHSVGVIIPKDVLAKLGLGEGETLYGIETPEGLRLSTSDPVFEEQMAVARRIMKERWAVLRELAK
jgi:putative addiction module antidote